MKLEYKLDVNPKLLKEQRERLVNIISKMKKGSEHVNYCFKDIEALNGIQHLLDAIADQAHDIYIYGLDTILTKMESS